jgi:hypothetical protein
VEIIQSSEGLLKQAQFDKLCGCGYVMYKATRILNMKTHHVKLKGKQREGKGWVGVEGVREFDCVMV